MSGSTGAERVRSRTDYQQFVKAYTSILKLFRDDIIVIPTGSFISNPSKDSFGDIDLIICYPTSNSKVNLKRELIQYISILPDNIIVEFTSDRYKGKRYLNTGEIVTVRYYDPELKYSVQIDNIIATSIKEAVFKQSFLNLPAEAQGLLIGLMKTVIIEHPDVIKDFNCRDLNDNEEYEFNISSSEIQLRLVTYEPNTVIQIKKEIIWRSSDILLIKILLPEYDFTKSFEDIIDDIKRNIKSSRSMNRIKGMFKSMVTVKSGEVGTDKGNHKEYCLQYVSDNLHL